MKNENAVAVVSDPFGGPVTMPGGFSVSYVIPLGLDDVEVMGDHWRFSVSNSTSPTAITAEYTGAFPIKPGMRLPLIRILGRLNKNAVPSLTTTAAVADDALEPALERSDTDDIASYTVFVQKQGDQDRHQQDDQGDHRHKRDESSTDHCNNKNGNWDARDKGRSRPS